MDLKDTCSILLEKNTKKVKCYKFRCKEVGRELALHEHADHKEFSTITDIETGMSLFDLKIKVSKVTALDIKEGLTNFIKHFTLSAVKERLEELDKTTMEEKLNKGKKK